MRHLFVLMLIAMVAVLLAVPAQARPLDPVPGRILSMRVPESAQPQVSPDRETAEWLGDFETPDDWTIYSSIITEEHWQTDDWQPFDGANSWRCFSPDAGTQPFGGYENDWLDFLLSPPLTLDPFAGSAEFSFQFRAYLEDGNWDGANVWAFVGDDPQDLDPVLLTPVSPAYTESNVQAFIDWFGIGGTFPAWAGEGTEPFCNNWTLATVDLMPLLGNDIVQIGVAFASDGAYDSDANPDMFGFQVDDLLVTVDGETIWFDDADGGNIGDDPILLSGGDLFPAQTLTMEVIDNEDLAWSPTHYLGVESISDEEFTQYAEGPEFSLPELNAGESLWLDLYMNNDFQYTNIFPHEFYWRPEVYNPDVGQWQAASPQNYVYVGGNGGVWESFSSSGYTWDWDISGLAGMDGVKVRIMFHWPSAPPYFDHFRIDDVTVWKIGLEHDIATQLVVPYPTTVGTPVYGKVYLTNNTDNPESDFMALWSLNAIVYPLVPPGPYSLDPSETLELAIQDPTDPMYPDFWMPEPGDLGDNELDAYHTLGSDEIPDNDFYPVDLTVLPEGQFEAGVDSRNYYGSLSVIEQNEGPLVHIVPEEINPAVFGGMTYDIDQLRFYSFFHSAAGGAPANASMLFRIFEGGDTPGDIYYTFEYEFGVGEGYVGEYMVELDLPELAELQNRTGDFWVQTVITDMGPNGGYAQPFPFRTGMNASQQYQFYGYDDAMAGDYLEEHGHHITAVLSASDQQAPVTLDLIPLQTDVPSNGGSIYYGIELVSNAGCWFEDVLYWVDITAPGGVVLEQYRTATFTLWPHRTISIQSIENAVPGWAPDGDYLFEGHVGYLPNPVIMDSFSFTKGGAPAGETVGAWKHQELKIPSGQPADESQTPSEYALSIAWPNPFNPSTTLEVMLPEAVQLSVTVYNVSGRQVARLADGRFDGGRHAFTWDASGLASGLYFVRAIVPGELNQVRKLMLVR